jgi:hypothetical protein
VSVFDLEKVADNAVANKGANEIISGFLIIIFESFNIEFIKIFEIPDFFFDSVNTLSIG